MSEASSAANVPGDGVVPEVEHHVVEVRADDLEPGPDLLAVELGPLHPERAGQHPEPARVPREEPAEERLVEAVDVLEGVEHRVGRAQVEEGRDVGLPRVELDQERVVRRLLGEADGDIDRHRGHAEAALGREHRHHAARLAGVRRRSPPHAGDLLERRREVVALHGAGKELEGPRSDDLDHELGRDATAHGEDGRFRQRVRELADGLARRVAVPARGRRRDLDEHEIGAAIRGLEQRLPDLAELPDHDRSRHAAEDLAEGGSGLGVRVDDDDAEHARHGQAWLTWGREGCSGRMGGP